MIMDSMPLFVIYKQFCSYRCTVIYVLLCYDRSSQFGLKNAWNSKAEVTQTPANTSHFLQPCDQDINKKYKWKMRTVRDDILKGVVMETKCTGFKSMYGVKPGRWWQSDMSRNYLRRPVFDLPIIGSWTFFHRGKLLLMREILLQFQKILRQLRPWRIS